MQIISVTYEGINNLGLLTKIDIFLGRRAVELKKTQKVAHYRFQAMRTLWWAEASILAAFRQRNAK